MNAKHTPTPWSLETVRTSCGIVHRIGPFPWKQGRTSHACVYVDYPSAGGDLEAELLANARLIAAAPDLLAALQAAIALADKNVWRDPTGQIHRTPECTASYDKCVAAIAKATGSAS